MAKTMSAKPRYDSPFGINSPFVKKGPLRKTSFDVWDHLPREDRKRIRARTLDMKDFQEDNANDLEHWSGHVFKDRKPNKVYDQNDLYKYFITIFTSKDPDALEELYYRLEPLEYEIIFLMEDNSRDTQSTPTYFLRLGSNVQANQLVDPTFLNVHRITRLIIDHGIPCNQINPLIVKDLLDKAVEPGGTKYKNLSLKEVVWGMYTPFLQGVSDITGGIGDGINSVIKFLDKLKIGSSSWSYAIGDENMDLFFFPFYERQAQPVDSEDVKKMLNRLRGDIEKNFNPSNPDSFKLNLIGSDNGLPGTALADWASDYFESDVMVKVYKEFSDLMDDLELAMDRMVEGGVLFVNAFLCGFWNSIVSCVQGILFIFYLAFKVASAIFGVYARPEAVDNFIQMMQDFDFKAFTEEVTAMFREAWEVFKDLDWVAIAAEIKVAQIGYFVGGLAEFLLEIIVGGLIPGVGLALTIIGKSARIFGEILEIIAKIFRKIIPNKPGKTIDFTELTFQLLRSNRDDMIKAIREAKKALILWLKNLHLILGDVSWETVQGLSNKGIRIVKLSDFGGISPILMIFNRVKVENVFVLITEDGRVIFKGTRKMINAMEKRITDLPDEEAKKLIEFLARREELFAKLKIETNGQSWFWKNASGTELSWARLSRERILENILKKIDNPKDLGDFFEGKVAKEIFDLSEKYGDEITDFSNEVWDLALKKLRNGDIDCATEKYIFEVKTQLHNIDNIQGLHSQLQKYLHQNYNSVEKYMNPLNKKVVVIFEDMGNYTLKEPLLKDLVDKGVIFIDGINNLNKLYIK